MSELKTADFSLR